MKTVTGIILALCFVQQIQPMGFVKISTSMGSGPKDSLFTTLEASNVLSSFLDKESSIENLMNQTFNNLFGQLDELKVEHPDKPDKKTQRVILLTAIAQTKRNLRGAFDVRKFISKGDNQSYLTQKEENCQDGKKCKFLELRAKQLGRAVDNVNDEIKFWNDVNKDKKCEYLNVKVDVQSRVVANLNLVINWIKENNKEDGVQGDKREVALACLDNDIESLQQVIAFLQKQLAKLRVEEKTQVQGVCPYLDLRIRQQARKVANDSSTLILYQWLNRKRRDQLEDDFVKTMRGIVSEVRTEYKVDGTVLTEEEDA